MTIFQLSKLIREFYGYKGEVLRTSPKYQKIDFTLYDSFSLSCGFNEHGSFDAWINLPNEITSIDFVGYNCSLIESNDEDISNALQKIDDYCRFLLPDKFLRKYDEAYKRKGHYIDISGRFHYMQEEKMTLNQIADFLKEFYGSKIKILQVSNDKQEIDFILYNALSFNCGLDDHKSFGAALQLPNGFGTTSFLGYECSLIEDNESDISVALQNIDDFCRARLPDKYLEMYDKVYKEQKK